MPIVEPPPQEQFDMDQGSLAPPRMPAPVPEEPAPPILDTVKAAFRQSNLGGMIYDRITHPAPDTPAAPGFDPIVSIPKGYELYGPELSGAQSPDEMEWRRQQIDREIADRHTIANSGTLGMVASFSAGLTDPLTLASMLVPVVGETRLITALRVAALSGSTSAAQELAAQGLSLTRTQGESLENVGGSAVVGGILGAVLHSRVPPDVLQTMSQRAYDELHATYAGESIFGPDAGRSGVGGNVVEFPKRAPSGDLIYQPRALLPPAEGSAEAAPVAESAAVQVPGLPDPPLTMADHPINPNAESTAGAAAVSTPTLRGEGIASGAQILDKALSKMTPGGRLLNSPSIVARQLFQEMANVPFALEKNYAGEATANPIERELWLTDGDHYQGMQARGEQFKAYRERMAGLNREPMSQNEFGEAVAGAMRRNDKSDIPEVQAAAKATRPIWDKWKDRAVAVGALDKDVKPKFMPSYLMRQYDPAKINADLTGWHNRLRSFWISHGMDPAEAADLSYSVTRNVLGGERATMDWHTMDGIAPKSGRFKEKTLPLPDTYLEPYLNNDINSLEHSYLRSIAPETLFRERFGTRDIRDQMGDLNDDYARMIERAGSNAAKNTLMKRQAQDIRDLTGIQNRLYGIEGASKDPNSAFIRAGRMLRSINALRMLGTATISHAPDLANVMMRYGLPNTFAGIGKVLASSAVRQLTFEEAKRLGAALDMTMNASAARLGDYANHSAWGPQQFLNRVTKGFTIATGETPLITIVQGLTSTLAQDEIIRSALKVAAGGKLDKNLVARLNAAGLSTDTLKAIAAQHQQFGADVHGLHFGMSDQWTDTEAARAFESAVVREAHSVTLRPGVGDTPLLMSTNIGKTIGQFKSFGFSAARSVTAPLLQGLTHGDPRAATALVALVSMGALAYYLKQKIAGQPVEPWNSPKFAAEVLDKSNILGWTGDFLFPAANQLGLKRLSRWSDRDPVETLLGPSAGTIADAFTRGLPGRVLHSVGAEEGDEKEGFRRSDLHFIRKMMPAQNLWYLRNGINMLEDRVGDAFDLPGKSNADRTAENATQ